MVQLMRCTYCGLLQDEPVGIKECSRCGGSLEYDKKPLPGWESYLQVQMELDQVSAPAGRNIERYLLLTLRTPVSVPPGEAAPVGKPRPPLSFCAVLDVSGSMQGEKIIQAKQAVRQSLNYLHDGDVFSLVTFANETHLALKPTVFDQSTRQLVERTLEGVSAGGMTALSAGMDLGIEKIGSRTKDTNLVLLLSDGQANVGETDLERIGLRAHKARQKGMLVSTLGVGMDYNEALMSEIATQGGGRFYHVLNANQIPAYVAGELGEVANLAAREVKAILVVPSGATLIPLTSAYPIEQAGEQAVVTLGDIPCDTELEVPLRLAMLAQSAGTRLALQGNLTLTTPAGNGRQLPINRVTVRFVESASFQLREGVVQPVAERVFTQMKASGVLRVSRSMAQQPSQAPQQTETIMADLRAYAELIGDEKALKEFEETQEQVQAMRQAPAAAKQVVADAHRVMRAAKDFKH